MSRNVGHRHPVNQVQLDQATRGQRAAEQLARVIGSWRFLIVQSFLLGLWIVLNVVELFFRPWDPYPFILLNLMLSFQAAYTGPVLLIAANRGAERDRLLMEHQAQQMETQEQLLVENTRLTKAVHELTTEIRELMRHRDGATP